MDLETSQPLTYTDVISRNILARINAGYSMQKKNMSRLVRTHSRDVLGFISLE